MDGATMVIASTGAMSSLLAKLAHLLDTERRLLGDVEKDIAFLRDELSSMNALLVRLAGADELDPQTEWQDTVRELAYDAEDCVDVYSHHLGHGGGGGVDVTRRLRAVWARRGVAGMIQELKARVDGRARYRLDETAVAVAVGPRLQQLYAGDASGLVAMDGTRENTIRRLMEEDDDHQQVRVVSVVGFGGVEKTTVANQVYAKIKGQSD